MEAGFAEVSVAELLASASGLVDDLEDAALTARDDCE